MRSASVAKRLNSGHTMKKWIIFIAATFLTGCAFSRTPLLADREGYWADMSPPSGAHNSRLRFLILHYTAEDNPTSLKVLTGNEVSAHYLVMKPPPVIAGKPVVLSLVPESERAWHAGVSHWNTRSNLNDSSVGIEIVNRGYCDRMLRRVWYPFDRQQIKLVKKLARGIIQRYGITPDNVLGHSDIAPQRKSDPGPLFPWQELAKAGIGAWPDPILVSQFLAGRNPGDAVSVKSLQVLLAKYGYDIPQNSVLDDKTKRVISAFQMHFRPLDFSGKPDAQTQAIAESLVYQYRH